MSTLQRQMIAPFSHLVGQEKAKLFLGRALESGQLAHAYLFRGPDGVGKQLFARSLAAAVNCRQRQAFSSDPGASDWASLPCGRCSSCVKYSSGNHPDFMVISPEKGTIKIDRIREMIQALSYPPYESASRVVLIEDIHTMRPEAANCLLKTLEEPPDKNLLILTASASREILTTISSRCQMVPFFSLREEDTTQVLMRVNPELEAETARLLARLSEGCPGQALVLYRSEMIAIWRQVVALVSDPQKDSNRDVGLLLQAAETMAALKEDLLPLFGLLRIWLRDLLVAGFSGQTGEQRDAIDGGLPEIQQKRWNSRQLFDKLQAIDQAEKELGRNCNRNLVCEVLLFQLQQ
ncbi:MAG: DNA polymerase III subunit delta' [Desulfobulbaceae bacterium]|nr:DNA polymerase III subunit delta' [Desulfobulbaceae bacterium]